MGLGAAGDVLDITPTHSSWSRLRVPTLRALALGTLEVAGKVHPHLSMGCDEAMGAQLMPPPPRTHPPCGHIPLHPQGQVTVTQAQSNQRNGVTPPRGPQAGGEGDPPQLTGWPQHRRFTFTSRLPPRQEKGKALCFPQPPFQQPGDPLQGLCFSNIKTLHIINLHLL